MFFWANRIACFGGSVLRRPISLNLADGFNPLSQCAKMDC